MTHDEAHAAAHEKAIADYTAESYLLDELSDAEAEAFEQHYLDCRVCSATIRAGEAMFAAGKQVVREDWVSKDKPGPDPEPVVLPFRKRIQQWVPSVAAAALAIVLVLQYFQPTPVPEPQYQVMEIAVPAGAITSVTRAAEADLLIHFEGQRPVEVVIMPSRDRVYPRYQVELSDASGKVLHVLAVSPGQARHIDGVPVLLRALPTGRYVLAIQGVREDGNRLDIAGRNVVVQ
jgi:hypothetical protein